MAEDTGVNIPVRWPDPATAQARVQRMQTKLHQWARADEARRFDDLYNLVYDPATLVVAFQRVAANAGARTAGVDRATIGTIRRDVGEEAFLHDIREALKQRTFRPLPVREQMIPKPGTSKRRRLVRDSYGH